MAHELFQVRNLSFAYQGHQVFEELSLTVEEGKITTFLGANGCGKSTLLHLMTRGLRPQRGEVLLRGEPLSQIKGKAFARQVAMVHQHNTAPPDVTVERLVGYGRTPHHTFGRGTDARQDREMVEWAMEITHTAAYRDQGVSQLSGGQKQRVWVALALAQGAKVLVLDEPTTYLDIRYQLELLRLIQSLNRQHGMTVLMVLHDINQSLVYSDHIVAMKEGRVVAQGDPAQIVTPQLMEQVYGVALEVGQVGGKPFVLPV